MLQAHIISWVIFFPLSRGPDIEIVLVHMGRKKAFQFSLWSYNTVFFMKLVKSSKSTKNSLTFECWCKHYKVLPSGIQYTLKV